MNRRAFIGGVIASAAFGALAPTSVLRSADDWRTNLIARLKAASPDGQAWDVDSLVGGRRQSVCGVGLSDGTYCMHWPLKGRKRCKRHGGGTPIGPASPYKHGRHRNIRGRWAYRKCIYSDAILGVDHPSITAVIVDDADRQFRLLEQRTWPEDFE